MWRISLPIVGALLFAGCTVNQDLMFRTEAEYAFASLDETKNAAYTLAPNDRIQLQVYSNRGQRLVSITAGSAEENRGLGMVQNQQRALSSYRVEVDGTGELPEVGKVFVGGLTLEEAESTIEDAYRADYVDPYVLLQVVNNRVLVFPGEAGQATVITLEIKHLSHRSTGTSRRHSAARKIQGNQTHSTARRERCGVSHGPQYHRGARSRQNHCSGE